MKTASTFFLFLFFCQIATAQLPDSIVGQFSANFIAGFPTGDFANEMDDNAYGLDLAFLARIPRTPVLAGARFGYLHFSRYKIDYDEPIGETGFDSEFDWITASQAIFLGGVFRVQPAVHPGVHPYFQGEIGARRLFTNSRLVNRNDTEDGLLGNDLEVADWAPFYSGKAGVQFILTKDKIMALDLGCTFSYAGSAEFFRKINDPGNVADPLDAFERRRSSATAMVIPSLGFTFNISKEKKG